MLRYLRFSLYTTNCSVVEAIQISVLWFIVIGGRIVIGNLTSPDDLNCMRWWLTSHQWWWSLEGLSLLQCTSSHLLCSCRSGYNKLLLMIRGSAAPNDWKPVCFPVQPERIPQLMSDSGEPGTSSILMFVVKARRLLENFEGVRYCIKPSLVHLRRPPEE